MLNSKIESLKDYNRKNRNWNFAYKSDVEDNILELHIWKTASGNSETKLHFVFNHVKKEGCEYLLYNGLGLIGKINSNTVPDYLTDILNSLCHILKGY